MLPAGLTNSISPYGRGYVYSFSRALDDLDMVEGLR
jgi:hypothetical protein